MIFKAYLAQSHVYGRRARCRKINAHKRTKMRQKTWPDKQTTPKYKLKLWRENLTQHFQRLWGQGQHDCELQMGGRGWQTCFVVWLVLHHAACPTSLAGHAPDHQKVEKEGKEVKKQTLVSRGEEIQELLLLLLLFIYKQERTSYLTA